MNNLIVMIVLFWLELVVTVISCFCTYKLYHHRQLRDAMFLNTKIPLKHVALFVCFIGFLFSIGMFLASAFMAMLFGVRGLAVFFFSF